MGGRQVVDFSTFCAETVKPFRHPSHDRAAPIQGRAGIGHSRTLSGSSENPGDSYAARQMQRKRRWESKASIRANTKRIAAGGAGGEVVTNVSLRCAKTMS